MKIGEQAPDLSFSDHEGIQLRLRDLFSEGCVVVFFYPRDNTVVCTKEACSFRDSYDDFLELGASVVGISPDSDESHSRFASKHNLPFHLVSDEDGQIRKAFGVSSFLGILPKRMTFVIDTKGAIRNIVRDKYNASSHIDQSLDLVRKIQNQDSNGN